MASIVANLQLPLCVNRRRTLLRTLPKCSLSSTAGSFFPSGVHHISEGQHRIAVVAKATGENSESTSLSIVESVQNVWDKSEDRFALIGLGFAAVVALWASANLVTAIDKLPLIPGAFELIGILFSSWFVYRYLLFKPDREELFLSIKKSASEILGQ